MILPLSAGKTQTDVRHAHTCTDDSSATGGVVQGARLVDRGRQLPSRSRSARGKRGRYTGDGRSGCPGLQYLHREATLHERDELITVNDAQRTRHRQRQRQQLHHWRGSAAEKRYGRPRCVLRRPSISTTRPGAAQQQNIQSLEARRCLNLGVRLAYLEAKLASAPWHPWLEEA